MSSNTNTNLNDSGYATAEVKGNTAIALNWPWDRQRSYKQQCERHGSHDSFGLSGFTIKHNGVEHVPRDDAALSYCPDCLGEFRARNIDYSDAPDVEVIEAIITVATRWREFRDGFERRYLRTAGELSHCPFCGSEFTASNQEEGRVTCPEHGSLSLDVQQLR